VPERENNDSLDLCPVVPDAPQHYFDDAVLIRDRQHAGGVRGGKIPCLRRNMKMPPVGV